MFPIFFSLKNTLNLKLKNKLWIILIKINHKKGRRSCRMLHVAYFHKTFEFNFSWNYKKNIKEIIKYKITYKYNVTYFKNILRVYVLLFCSMIIQLKSMTKSRCILHVAFIYKVSMLIMLYINKCCVFFAFSVILLSSSRSYGCSSVACL